MRFEPIAQVRDAAQARAVIVALRAYGFHPLDLREGGLPGLANLFGPEGFQIEVPEGEAGDAAVLVGDLLKDMQADTPQNRP